jgi:hypothetical protein
MFYERVNQLVLFFSALSATVIFVAVVATLGKGYELAFSFFLAVITFVDLIVNSSRKARLHSDLYTRFISLEQQMVLFGDEATEPQLRKIVSDRLAIEGDEPPVLTVLNMLCHNELVIAGGYARDELISITTGQRFCAHLFSYGEENFFGGAPVESKNAAPPGGSKQA